MENEIKMYCKVTELNCCKHYDGNGLCNFNVYDARHCEHASYNPPKVDQSGSLTGYVDGVLTNRCKDCIFSVQFAQVGAENHVLNICCSENNEPDCDGGEELLEISKFNADQCLNYLKET